MKTVTSELEVSLFFAENLSSEAQAALITRGFIYDEGSKIYYDPARLRINEKGEFVRNYN
jgi:hypothetical protein